MKLTALIIYRNKHYIKLLDLDDSQYNKDYVHFEYGLTLRDMVLNGLNIKEFLKDAIIDNTKTVHDVNVAYRIGNKKVYFYEYVFDIWECANDYKNYEDEDCTKEVLERLDSMPYTIEVLEDGTIVKHIIIE